MDKIITTIWGTDIKDIGEGFCLSCEHAFPSHFTNCDYVQYKKENG